MIVLVVATNEACPATFALRSERIEYDFVSLRDDFTYGQTLHEFWARGFTFINIEHDIAPWPGAVNDIYLCDEPFCAYSYPVGHSGTFQTALGLVKFSQELIGEYPEANFGWDQTLWNHLDAQVYGALQIDRGIKPHIHTPPVAHLKPFKEEAMDLAQIMARCQ